MNPVINLTLLQLLLGTAGIALISLIIKSKRQLKAKKRIVELENEMLSCHREILELSSKINHSEKPGTDSGNNYLYKVSSF